jgi:hypothetical protein
VDVDFDADLSLVDVGYNKLFVSTKDEDGKWSLVFKQDVYKAGEPTTGLPLPDIMAMEYYFDIDPGFGNGENIPLTSDSLVDVDFDADLSLVDVGYHKLFVRTKDEDGKWSLVFKQDVYKAGEPTTGLPLPDIVAMEYYFDIDPGFGNGENIPLTSDSLVDVDFDADLSLVDVGYHKLFVRTKDEDGKWSLVFKQDVYKAGEPTTGLPLPNIVQLEYFIDTDPGYGNGINVPLIADSIIDEMLLPDITGLSLGEHNLLYRVKDENNRWSLTNVTPFYIMGLKAFLQGPYDILSDIMDVDLNNSDLIPLQQPYGSDPSAKYYYTGAENVPAIPNEDVVDWAIVQIRDASNPTAATSATIKETKAVFLLKDGSLVGLDGVSPIAFTSIVDNDIYVVIFHRNHLGIMNSGGIPRTGTEAYTYDFSTSDGQVYGGGSGYKLLEDGVWGMVAADGNGNGIVENTDETAVWKVSLGQSGYDNGDFDLNGVVQNTDETNYWKPNLNSGGQVPGKSSSGEAYKSQVPD